MTPRRWRALIRAPLSLVLMILLGASPYLPAYAATPATSVSVTTTHDVVDGNVSSLDALLAAPGDDGQIALREAMLAAEATPPGPALTIGFDLSLEDDGYDQATGTWLIILSAQPRPLLPPLLRGGLTIDGLTQPGAAGEPVVIVDGFEVVEEEGFSHGFVIKSAGNMLRGLALINFYDTTVLLEGPGATGNIIASCMIGESPRGVPEQLGYYGVELLGGASGNQIGGGPAERNTIVANLNAGVSLRGADTLANTVAGNWIGVGALEESAGNQFGVSILDNADENLIGGAGQGNVISGNAYGVYLRGAAGNQVAGNLIGLGPDGMSERPNQQGGLYLTGGAQRNLVGGTAPGERNVIAANGEQGIYIANAGSDENSVYGNYIGLAADGRSPRGNLRQGVLVAFDARNNRIGGTAPGQRNVIVYNGLGGVRIDSDQNSVAGNLIGVSAVGDLALGNQSYGVRIIGDSNLVVGNQIANNQIAGLIIGGADNRAERNQLIANAIVGVCVTGVRAKLLNNAVLENGQQAGAGAGGECDTASGIFISGAATLAHGNTILSNQGTGVLISRGVGNTLQTNSISANSTSGITLSAGGNQAIEPPQIVLITSQAVFGQACPSCAVEVFADDGNQGRDLVGVGTAGSDGAFRVPFTGLPARGHITATHTDLQGNTSPFAVAPNLPGRTPLNTLVLPAVVAP